MQAKQVFVKALERKAPILLETDLEINEGEFIVVLGHNGSGKSTLVKILAGQRVPTGGDVFLNGIKLKDIPLQQRAIDLISISQKPEEKLFIDLTLEENIFLWESRFPKIERVLSQKICDLTTLPKKFQSLLDQKVKNLSGGEKQLFLFALSVAHPPKILFLDEHTSALDPKASNEVMQATAKTIEKYKITTIMVTHKLEDAIKYGNRIIVMNEGSVKINQDKPPFMTIEYLKALME